MNRRAGPPRHIATIAFAIGIVTAVACVPERVASSPSGASSSTPPSASSFVATPSAARPSPSPAPDPSRSSDPAGGIRAHALGRLIGNWIFVGKQVPYPHQIWAEAPIWAIPLDAGTPQLAFAYDVSLVGIPEAIFDNTPYLRRSSRPTGHAWWYPLVES